MGVLRDVSERAVAGMRDPGGMADRPTGTVTFLFTDVEGSTRFWEDHPADMQAALERHDAVLRSVIDSCGGYVFTTAGDSFAAAFGRAADAVVAAAMMQRALASQDWPAATPVRVRMGLHTGEAQERDGDYFGPVLNRAARVMAAGHGGQVLVSASTVSVLPELPADLKLMELGSHRLRDLSEPVELWMLGGEGLEEQFPPLRVSDGVPGNLPTMLTSLVGRTSELVDLQDLTASHRLVTLVGPGGMGKTRLAVHAGAEAAWRFPDGVWFVDLLAISRNGVVAAVAAALRIQLPVDGDAAAALGEALRGQRLMIVLDNCEHVLGEVADLTMRLLGATDGVAVLATSRQPLAVAGEQLFPVESMGTASTSLFVDRARLVTPGFHPDKRAQATINRLCQELDGMPLAIELAASRLRTYSLEELAAGLTDRFRLLRPGRRGRDARRHATSLADTLDWSYELLDADEQVLFDRCSVFAGSFTRNDVAAVCGDESLDEFEVGEILDSLVDKSLVRARDGHGGAGRLDLLDTMRAYGRDRLVERGAADDIAGRHARWFAEFTFETGTCLFGPGAATRLAALAASVDNCRAAFEYLRIHDPADAQRLCGGFTKAGWLLITEPYEWAVSLWPHRGPGDNGDTHLWFCATVAWAAMTFQQADLLEQVHAHLGSLNAPSTHPAVIEAQFPVFGDNWYSKTRQRRDDILTAGRELLENSRASGAAGLFPVSALMVSPFLPRDEAITVLNEGVAQAEADNTECAWGALLATRTAWIEADAPDQAVGDLQLALEIATAVDSPFVANISRDMLIHTRTSPLSLDEKIATADQLLVEWHRAGDQPRLFNTLATTILLLDTTGQPEDIVALDDAITAQNAGHQDRRVRRRQARVVEEATANLGHDQLRAARQLGRSASPSDLLIRARAALTRRVAG